MAVVVEVEVADRQNSTRSAQLLLCPIETLIMTSLCHFHYHCHCHRISPTPTPTESTVRYSLVKVTFFSILSQSYSFHALKVGVRLSVPETVSSSIFLLPLQLLCPITSRLISFVALLTLQRPLHLSVLTPTHS